MSKTTQEYVDDLNNEITEQWSQMISNINRNLAKRYAEKDTRPISEIFSQLESLYFHHIELNVGDYQFVSLEEGFEGDV